MRGSIKKRGSTYQITVNLERTLDGKRNQKSKGGFKTKKEAEKVLAKWIIEIEEGDFVEINEMLLKDFFTEWLTNVENKIARNTYIFYKGICDKNLTPTLGNIKLNKLKPFHIDKFLAEQLKREDINGTTIRHFYSVLNISLNRAVKWNFIQINPCNNVDPPSKADKEMKILNLEEVDYLLSYLKYSQHKVFYIPTLLAVTCGLRRGEALGLQWANVDLENSLIHIKDNYIKIDKECVMSALKTKGSKRTIPLIDLVVSELNEWKLEQKVNIIELGPDYEKNDFVCTWNNGRQTSPDYVGHQFHRIFNKIDIPKIRFHDLRHTYATLLLTQDVDIKITSTLLGHSTLKTTEIYTHVANDMKIEATKKLNKLFPKKNV